MIMAVMPLVGALLGREEVPKAVLLQLPDSMVNNV